MVRFSDEYKTIEVADKFKKMLLRLKDKIDSLDDIEVGINISTKPSAFDVVLTADFENEVALNDYREHPEHIIVLDYMKMVVSKVAVVDYLV